MARSSFLGEEAYLDQYPVANREINGVSLPIINGVVINNFIISDFNGALFALEAIPPGSDETTCPSCDVKRVKGEQDLHERYPSCSTLKRAGKAHREEQEVLIRLIFAAVKAVKPKESKFKDILAKISEIQKELRGMDAKELANAAQELFEYERAEINAMFAVRKSQFTKENLNRIFDEFYLLRMQLRTNLSLKEKPVKPKPGYKWAGRRITKLSETWAQNIQLKNWSGDKMLPDISEKKDTLTDLSGTSLVKNNITTKDMLITDYYVPG